MLLFSDDPEKWQLGAFVKVGYFDNDADLRYQDEIHGALLDQVDRVVEIVQLKYMKAMISYEGIQRIEKYFVPDAALREAVLNALCHKDYASGIPIQISVYADKLYISNCGRLPEHWTTDSLFVKHPSKPYNPNIAHVFYLAGFIESWGRGVEKICVACENDGAPIPEYSVNPGDIMIKFSAAKSMQQKEEDRVGEKVGENEVENEVEKTAETKFSLEEKILALLLGNPNITKKKIESELSVSHSTVDRIMKKMKEANIIERVGSDRNGYWKVNLPK